jgi:hypothetical protein
MFGNMMRLCAMWIAFAPAAATVADGMQLSDAQALERAQMLAQAYADGKTSLVWQAMSPDLQMVFATSADFHTTHQELVAKAGHETAVIDERYNPQRRQYVRVATWSKPGTQVVTKIFHNAEGVITGFASRLDAVSSGAVEIGQGDARTVTATAR